MKENNRGKNRLNNNEKKDNKFDKKPDSNLPFFAYGIFKPGQIAYSKGSFHKLSHEAEGRSSNTFEKGE